MPDILFWDRVYSRKFDFLGFEGRVLHPRKEIFYYELQWALRKRPFLRPLGDNTKASALPPSHAQLTGVTDELLEGLASFLESAGVYQHETLIRGSLEYPDRLRFYDVPLLYYQGDISLLAPACVAIAGSRKPKPGAKVLAEELANALATSQLGIVAGVAEGCDTILHQCAMNGHKRSFAVLGTGINSAYSADNSKLQELMARKQLVISHVPLYRSARHDWDENRHYLAERYKIMVALSAACVILDFNDNPGASILAREALKQGKPLVLFEQALKNAKADWLHDSLNTGNAVAVTTVAAAQKVLEQVCHTG